MSINTNCQEYLLTIAEKIIDAFADSSTQHKYYSLKDNLAKKYTLS